ncbi:hypothetical protein C8R47DRAFT_1189369 [Mycena vitilis]|nr:hypothetical protein C8R47DRAFT_1199067 [Mycena vitilis]KAJ6517888.1 hypothetical protein C8R47DRAFT_1189369 [Mycena vitilis]
MEPQQTVAPPRPKPKKKNPVAKAPVADSDYEEAGPGGKRGRKPVAPRSPLPARSTRVKSPGAPDRKRKKRTPEEVAAAAASEATIRGRIAELEQLKMAHIAQLEMDEEDADEEAEDAAMINDSIAMMPTNTFGQIGARFNDELNLMIDTFQQMSSPERDRGGSRQSVSTAGRVPMHQPLFNPPSSPEVEATARPTKGKKVAKGNVRDTLETMKEEMRQSRENAARIDFLKLQSKFPTGMNTGLNFDWRNMPTSGQGSKPGTTNKGAKKTASGKASGSKIADDSVFGGLSDGDIGNKGPFNQGSYPPKHRVKLTAKSRNQNRTNDDVLVLSSDDEPVASSRPIGAPKKKTAPATIRVKTEPVQAQSSMISIVDTPSPADMIPAFIAAIWDRTWMPTFLHMMGEAEDPWDISIEDLVIAFSIVYPLSGYNLKAPGNLVLKRTRDRLNNGRSWFGIHALSVMIKFFKTAQFTKTAEGPKGEDLPAEEVKARVRAFVAIALQPKGLMLFTTPQVGKEPEEGEEAEPGYVPASGFCETQFVISILSPFVKKIANSRLNFRCLVGALALTNASLEKTFLMFTTGEHVDDGLQFSRDNVAHLVDDYTTNIKTFSLRKWDVILRLCGTSNAESQPTPVSAPAMTGNRRELYVSSSPIRAPGE